LTGAYFMQLFYDGFTVTQFFFYRARLKLRTNWGLSWRRFVVVLFPQNSARIVYLIRSRPLVFKVLLTHLSWFIFCLVRRRITYTWNYVFKWPKYQRRKPAILYISLVNLSVKWRCFAHSELHLWRGKNYDAIRWAYWDWSAGSVHSKYIVNTGKVVEVVRIS
jgi:hypothetical protein